MIKEDYISFYQQYKAPIVSGSIIISCVVIIVFVVLPMLRGLLETKKTYDDVVSQVQTLEVKAKDLEGLDSSDLKKKVDIVLTSLPSERDYPGTFGLIQQLAVQSGVKLTSMQVGQSLGDPSKSSGFNIKVNIAGSQGSLKTFADNVNKAYKVMRISSIEVGSFNSGVATNAVLGIDIFFALVPDKLGSLNSKLPQLTEKDNELLTTLSQSVPVSSGETFVPSPKGKSNPFE